MNLFFIEQSRIDLHALYVLMTCDDSTSTILDDWIEERLLVFLGFAPCLCESYHTASQGALQGLLQTPVCWSCLELSRLLSLWEILHFGPWHHHENWNVSAKCQMLFSSGSWWGSQWIMKYNITLFWFDQVVGSVVNVVLPEDISDALTYAYLRCWGVVSGLWNPGSETCSSLFPSKPLSIWEGEGCASFVLLIIPCFWRDPVEDLQTLLADLEAVRLGQWHNFGYFDSHS